MYKIIELILDLLLAKIEESNQRVSNLKLDQELKYKRQDNV